MTGQPKLLIGSAMILLAVLAAVFAPVLAPADPYASSVMMLERPSASAWLGTDELGRDVLSRVIWGARPSLQIGIAGAAIAILVGTFVGLVAGYYRGLADALIVPVIDLFISLPVLVLALIVTVLLGPSLPNLIAVLGFVMWPPVARLVRGQVFAIRETTYIEAAQALGGSSLWIVRSHVLPNVGRIVASQFAVTVAFAIFTSASLSFLGLGVPPPTPDWGGLVRTGFDYLVLNPWMSLGPGAAVMFTAMGFYLVGSSVK